MKIIDRATFYFQSALTELHHVRWPTRNQAVRLSVIVLGFALATALLYGIVDFLLGRGMTLLLSFV